MDTLHVGPLEVIFHRTVRVADDKLSNLPPSLGDLPIHSGLSGKDDNCFLALHDNEALWLDFSVGLPVAVMIGAGGVNALTGEPMTEELHEGNYLVTPPQPWLDGWKGQDGSVYQFVATPYKKGKGLSVAEQLLGEEASSELEIIVFESKDPNLIMVSKPQEICGTDPYEPCNGLVDSNSFDYKTCTPMGIGKGGKITQKVYPDPYGIDAWKSKCTSKVKVEIANAVQYAKKMGHELPPLPKSVEEYIGNWFNVKDQEMNDVKGSTYFDKLSCTNTQI